MFSILYLIKKSYHDKLVNRTNINKIKGLSNISNIKLEIWGPEWNKYDNNISVQNNIEKNYIDPFTIIIGENVDSLIKFNKLKSPTLLFLNNKVNFNKNIELIELYRPNILIIESKKIYQLYTTYYSTFTNQYIPYIYYIKPCGNNHIYMNYNKLKIYDILLLDNEKSNSSNVFFDRIKNILKLLSTKYVCKISNNLSICEEESNTSNTHEINFSKEINSSKLCIVISDTLNTYNNVYINIGFSNSVIVSDIDIENDDKLLNNIIHLNNRMSDDKIISKINYYLENTQELDKIQKKINLITDEYTLESYSKNLLHIINNYIKKNSK